MMYAFPPAEDINFFIGDRLDTITLAQFTLHFAFDGLCSVTTEYAITYIAAGEAPVRYDIQKFTAAPALTFHRCIGQNVVRLEVDTLQLRFFFENGDIIQFETDEIPYECGQIVRDARSGKPPVSIVF
jgi:hypothetical protein